MADRLVEPGGDLTAQQAIRGRCRHPAGGFEPWTPADVEQSIARRFAHQVSRHPERIAIRTPRLSLTYIELDRRANRIAHALLALAGPRTEPVGIMFANGAWFAAALLGVAKAGQIQVTLDSALPGDQIRAMLQLSGAAVILTDGAHAALARDLAGSRRRIIDVEQLADGPPGAPDVPVAAEAVAAINFTSGSTGAPKGITFSHRGLLHIVMRHAHAFGLCADDRQAYLRATSTPPLYALLVGGTCCPVDLRAAGIDELAPWMVEAGVTVYRSAVSAFRALTDTLTGGERFPDLRLVLVFGEAAYHTDVERHRRRFGAGALFASSLGCRETGDYAYFFADADTPLSAGVVPGGFVSEHMDVLVLDEAGRPAPPGEVGELAVRSAYAATGYWQRPDLTAVAFRPDPSGGDARVYRTGDVGRQRSDGCLLHLGRRDYQVKIRGHRVDLAAVEAALLEIDGVREAAVCGREDTPGDVRLVAYLVPGEQPLPSPHAIRRTLAARLPEYMVPSAFVPLRTMPRGTTGKVDRRALPRPARPLRGNGHAPTPPGTPVEAALAAIWAEVLGLETLGVDEAFIDLGGNSMLAAQIGARIHDTFDVRLPLRALLASPTVADMARAILEAAAECIGEPELARMLADIEGRVDGSRDADGPGDDRGASARAR
jgi:amino acid adenylation domain-containing protein